MFRLVTTELDVACPLVDTQWGFRAGRSTISALLSTVTHWLEILDAGMDICAVFFDYRKAFDSVPHQPLIEKLVAPGLNRHVVQWIADYLTSRTLQVVVEGEISKVADVLSGAPQGSVLGLLFLIYIDGAGTISLSPGSQRVMFADDLLLYRPISRPSEFLFVQEGIINIENWSTDNHLTLNPKKCKYMSVSRKRSPLLPEFTLMLNGEAFDHEQVDVYKYLGVLLCRDLSWSPHVDAVCAKSRKILGLLYRRFYQFCNSDVLQQLYISLVRPHLEYACHVWAPHTSKDIIELENVQKFACKMATRQWSGMQYSFNC